jgi:hypothetical protein
MIVSASNVLQAQPDTSRRSLQMRVLDPLREPAWDRGIASHRDGTCFHTTAWARVLHETYKHQPFYLQFFDRGRLAALVPLIEIRSPFTGRRGVCLPFSDLCAPLFFEPDIAGFVRDRLLSFAQQRRWHHIEIRGGRSLQLAPKPACRFYGHTLELSSDYAEIFGRFAGSVRRAIRKADRSEIKAVAVHNRQAVGEFYKLHLETRRRHGLPSQSVSFFRNIYEHIIKPGVGFIVLAQRESRTIAAAIFFRFGNNAIYKYGASDKRFQEFRANNLVLWHGIQFLVRIGVEKLHFGRTDCENDGLRRFKLSWGTREEIVDYYRIDPSGRQCFTPAHRDCSFHKKIVAKLPLVLNRMAGSIIYPHLD